MGLIKLKDIRIYTNHGCLSQENKIGSEYLVQIVLETNLDRSAKTDNLNDTVDYVNIYRIVEKEMKIRAKLLENVAERIVRAILLEEPRVISTTVEVEKLNPPINGNVKSVSIIRKGNQKYRKAK